jgi:hypothetical protein
MNEIPPPRTSETQKSFKKLFFILLTLGIGLGILVSIGLVKLLNEWGLTEKPQPTQVK